MLLVDRVIRHQAAVFGVKREDQPHQSCNQSAVQMIGIALRQLRGGSGTARLRRHEAAQQLVERREHLPGKPGGNLSLRIAAPGEKRRQPSLGIAPE